LNPKAFAKFLNRDKACVHCGTTDSTLIPQHRINRGMGGSKLLNKPSNIVVLCSAFNGLIEANAEAAALDEVPPVVGAVTEKTCLSCQHYTSEMNDLNELISESCNAPLPLFVDQGLRKLGLDYQRFFWDSYSAGASCNAHIEKQPETA